MIEEEREQIIEEEKMFDSELGFATIIWQYRVAFIKA
jgi:hypothetical protein